MTKYFIIISLCFSYFKLCAQKKQLIDSTAYNLWPTVHYNRSDALSNNGKYLVYSISDSGSERMDRLHYFIKSTTTNWRFELRDGVKHNEIKFTPDSKYCVFINNKDSLCILNLDNRAAKYIPKVKEFRIPEEGSGDYLFYKLIGKESELIVRNLCTNKIRNFQYVSFFSISRDGKSTVLLRRYPADSSSGAICWINTKEEKPLEIYYRGDITNVVIDFDHHQLAYAVSGVIWYFKLGIPKPVCLLETVTPGFDLSRLETFSKHGDRLFVTLNKSEKSTQIKDNKSVEVWSYNDGKPQTIQENESNQHDFLAVVGIKDHKLTQIQKYNSESFSNRQFEDFVISNVPIGEGYYREEWWNASSQNRYDLVNTKTGERKSLDFLQKMEILFWQLSPTGKYVIFYDKKKNGYFSYHTISGHVYALTKDVNTSWKRIGSDDQNLSSYAYRGIAAWLSNDQSVLIYDSHDIWRFDPVAKAPAVNITNGFGVRHDIVFSLGVSDKIFKADNKETLLLSAFNHIDKSNGFFKKRISSPGDPIKLTMGQYLYRVNSTNVLTSFDFIPIKAKNADIYLIQRQSATEAPNLFCTKDFKRMKQMTNVHPQMRYNWMTSELHKWKSLDGRNLYGIIYKPEDFDPEKSYPLIVYCYQKLSDGLNAFLKPDYSQGELNIPTFVSNGYLVFCPDIYYAIGDPMQGTHDAVVSAVSYLSKLPFVNERKIGLQGFSFGAIQANYLVCHTDKFAAVCSSSGLSDWISAYGTLGGNNKEGYRESLAGNFESAGQNRMGTPLWSNIAGYIKSSPIFRVDKISTPLLLMHTKNDAICPYANIMEFFLGLRRLGKKSWMLVYPDESHSLQNKVNEKDFTLRMFQFFDHYLKDKFSPVWMLDGVKAKNRRFNAGTELDTTGRSPGPGLLTIDKEQEIDSLTKESIIRMN